MRCGSGDEIGDEMDGPTLLFTGRGIPQSEMSNVRSLAEDSEGEVGAQISLFHSKSLSFIDFSVASTPR